MSNKSDFKYLSLIAAFIVCLGGCLGGYLLYNRLQVEKPLTAALEEQQSIKEVEIEKDEGIYSIRITLARVDNVQQEYKNLEQIIKEKLGDRPYAITVEGSGNPNLEKVYTEMQPVLYEALANHEYVWMQKTMADYSANRGIGFTLFVDDKRIYLQFTDKDSYQYHILSKENPTDIT